MSVVREGIVTSTGVDIVNVSTAGDRFEQVVPGHSYVVVRVGGREFVVDAVELGEWSVGARVRLTLELIS